MNGLVEAVVVALATATVLFMLELVVRAVGARFGRWAVIECDPGSPSQAGEDPIEPDCWVTRQCWTRWGATRLERRGSRVEVVHLSGWDGTE